MSWFLEHKKYKKLVKELLYQHSELEYQKEVLKDTHPQFEEYQHTYATKNNLNLQDMQEQNSENIDQIIPKQPPQEVNEEGIIVTKKKTKEDKEQIKKFSKVYKLVAKKIHPDKFANRFRTEEIEEKEELFKKASDGFESRDWAKLLEVAEQINVKPSNVKELCVEVRKEITKIKDKIKHNNTMYSWMFYQCEDNEECKDLIMADFFRRLFNYSP